MPARPFRAVAYVEDPAGGRRRLVAGRVAAATRPGLDRFLTEHRAAGHVVEAFELVTLLDDTGDA